LNFIRLKFDKVEEDTFWIAHWSRLRLPQRQKTVDLIQSSLLAVWSVSHLIWHGGCWPNWVAAIGARQIQSGRCPFMMRDWPQRFYKYFVGQGSGGSHTRCDCSTVKVRREVETCESFGAQSARSCRGHVSAERRAVRAYLFRRRY